MDGHTESWWILSGGNGDAWGCFEDKMIVFPPLMHNFVRIAHYTWYTINHHIFKYSVPIRCMFAMVHKTWLIP